MRDQTATIAHYNHDRVNALQPLHGPQRLRARPRFSAPKGGASTGTGVAQRVVMSQTTTAELKNEIHKSLERLRALRDEVRVQLHLAGMDAKDEWSKLEPQLEDAERKAHEFTEATRHALTEAVKKVTELRARLH